MKNQLLTFFIAFASIHHLYALQPEQHVIRTLDAPCNYNLCGQGKKPTYRELLATLLISYKTYANDAQKDQVVVDIEKAMELFGTGALPLMNQQQQVEIGFNYTLFKKSKTRFYDAIADKDFSWPLKIPPDQQPGYHVYDAHYALLGILQYNAYQSTGGDS